MASGSQYGDFPKYNCGAILEYFVHYHAATGIVGTATVGLVDIFGVGKAKEGYRSYVDQLSKIATDEKREQLKGANKPTL